MPRILTGAEIFKYLNKVEKITEATGTHGSTTTTAAITADAASVTVTAFTDFSAGDWCRIRGTGGDEIIEAGTPAATFPFVRPAQIPQNSGATLVECVHNDLGLIAEGGVQFGGTMNLTAINAATSRVAVAYWPSPAELTWQIPVLGHNVLNIQSIFGAPEVENGAGSAADPYVGVVNATNVGTESLHAYRCAGVLDSGYLTEVDFLGCTVQVNANVVLGAATPGGMTIAGRCQGFIVRVWSAV